MYSILLVDDEESVRSSICRLTPWKDYGFEVIAEASSGLEALEILSEQVPDLIITDIKMPYMNGIDLINTIRSRYSTTVEVIVLSGYDEFTYAQEALRLKVTEYVLKPVSVDDMKALLERTYKKIKEDKERFQNFQQDQPIYKEAISIYKERFLVSLLSAQKSFNKDKAIEIASKFQLSLSGNLYTVAVLESQEENAITQAIQSLAEETFEEEKEKPIIFQYDNQIVLIFCSTMTEIFTSLFKKQVFRVLNLLQESTGHYFKHPARIGVGNVVHSLQDLPLSYNDAIEALNYTTIYPDMNLIALSDIEAGDQIKEERNIGELKTDLIFSIKMGTKSDVERAVSNFFSDIAETCDIQASVLMILSSISEICSAYSKNIATLFNGDIFKALSHTRSLASAQKLCAEIAIAANEMANGARENSHIQFVENAKKIIRKRYSEPTFGLDQVCEEISVSPAYFSTTFKKETGTSFVQFLTNTRIEKAKELLKNSEAKTYEISEKVGFSEPNYFSFTFKKNVGLSPSQYRSKFRG